MTVRRVASAVGIEPGKDRINVGPEESRDSRCDENVRLGRRGDGCRCRGGSDGDGSGRLGSDGGQSVDGGGGGDLDWRGGRDGRLGVDGQRSDLRLAHGSWGRDPASPGDRDGDGSRRIERRLNSEFRRVGQSRRRSHWVRRYTASQLQLLYPQSRYIPTGVPATQ